jgi:hypothetical protein
VQPTEHQHSPAHVQDDQDIGTKSCTEERDTSPMYSVIEPYSGQVSWLFANCMNAFLCLLISECIDTCIHTAFLVHAGGQD